MSHTKFGLKTFGLCLIAVLGLTAFLAAGAQAQWLVNKTTLSGSKAVEILNHTTGLLLVPAKNLELECKLLHSDGAVINSSAPEILGTLLFSECTTFLSKVEQKACKPAEPIKAEGKGNLILHNSLNWVLLQPEVTGGNFTRVDFPVSCALPDTNISGSLVLECLTSGLAKGTNLCANEELTHLVQEAPAALFSGDGLFYGVSPATIDGVAKAKLESDENWAGHI